MERAICLDSDILIELVNGNNEIIQFIRQTEAAWHTTAINVFEIWSERNEKQNNAESLINGLEKHPFDESAAQKAGEIRRKLKEKGELLDIRDVFIAAVCIQNSLALYTNNKKHFERLKQFGLKLI